MIELSPSQAKRIVIANQGLHKANVFGKDEPALLKCIQRLGYVQIDTISVINRAHHHTFWTRIPSYDASQLDSLQRSREIFEYWSHAASYLPIQDYRYCLLYMKAIASGQKHWRHPDPDAMKMVLKRITEEGPLKARDFEPAKNSNPDVWGSLKPAKIALEQLFIEGKLMISHRDGFQKVFDLSDRVLPSDLDTSTPTDEEFYRYLIERAIESQGFSSESEIGYLRKGHKQGLKNQLLKMLASDELVQVGVRGNPVAYFSNPKTVEAFSSARVAKKVHLLSPFDNLVIQRKRIAQLFDFDYQIECYVPSDQRTFGYFCLPILFGSELIGRLDPKADRENGTLIIRNLVIEKDIGNEDLFVREFVRKLMVFAQFNGCDKTVIEKCNLPKIEAAVSDLLN